MKTIWTAESCESLPGRLDHTLTINGNQIACLCDRGNGQFWVGAYGIYGDKQVWIQGDLVQAKREVEADYLAGRATNHVRPVMHYLYKLWLTLWGSK